MPNGKPNPARQEYLRKWRREHKDRVAIYNQRYWEKRLSKWLEENESDNKVLKEMECNDGKAKDI